MAFAKRHIILEIGETAQKVLRYANSHFQKKIKKRSICCFTVVFYLFLMSCSLGNLYAQNAIRQEISLDQNWRSIEDDHNKNALDGFENPSFNDKTWSRVEVPNNWDAYAGYRRLLHGNRHGYAWYRKKFSIKSPKKGKHFFLYFEGVGSYATVWLNGKKVGYHAGGRTTFTIDVTNSIYLNNQPNLLAVRADHPAYIRDLPWVCGGCSDERGFSEGSQPMGIFRPVHLIITNDIRVQPFGVHIWNDTTVSEKYARLYIDAEVKNYGSTARNITLVNKLLNDKGTTVVETKSSAEILPGTSKTIHEEPSINNVHLWNFDDPYLYTLLTEVVENGKVIDRVTTPYGIRWISWPINKTASSNQFLLNGKPVFINGVAGYEHLIGKSHAFSAEQVRTRVMELRAAGFNAFRDAHQPHNLRYQKYWDSLGVLWWPQMSAHIWFDTPAFRKNFKTLLADWVKERRNSPSLILWGLQNESKLPADFAKECTDLIRKLDPTASSQRLVVTCNGGTGTDWDVPQNWTGTYGGDPATYANDLKKQILVGEYGAWRTLDLHTEGPFNQKGINSEDKMTQLLEMKVRLGESVKDSVAGHFMWLLTSHDNPGRVQGGEGSRELDRVGPVNYKGLFTPWEEPVDAFYMYRSNYAPKDKEPMVYIVSHTWPDRWLTPGIKNNIVVYSNCDEVELFNDVRSQSLGRRKRNGIGTHFQWDSVNIRYNVLYAVGYVNGKEVSRDYIVLNHLPRAPHFNDFFKNAKPITSPQPKYNYLYRVNCGGPDYVDENGNTWTADRERTNDKFWGSTSWTKDFAGMPAYFASQRRTSDPIHGTKDWKLFQTFRYGREKLHYDFPVPDGDYLVELYFTEPWLGRGGGINCRGWRLFDVAVNDKVVLKDEDIWKEAGYNTALKKTVKVTVKGGLLTISFPHVASGQAVISAIAIASLDKNSKPAKSAPSLIQNLEVNNKNASKNWVLLSWLDTGDKQYADDNVAFSALSPELYGAEWIQTPNVLHNAKDSTIATFTVGNDADIFIGVNTKIITIPGWLKDYENTNTFIENDFDGGQRFTIYRKRFKKGATVSLGYNGGLNNKTSIMYPIVVLPVSNMQPAYDLKPVTSYKAVDGKLYGHGLVKGIINGKGRVIFNKPSADNLLEWKFDVGVADMYSLTISYNNPNEKTINGTLEILSADGALLKKEDVEFKATRPGKSNYISTTTGTMINAGNYTVQLRAKDAKALSINSLDVQ
jgi:hypothetical protein